MHGRQNIKFLGRFSKSTQNLMEILPRADVFHADMTKQIFTFATLRNRLQANRQPQVYCVASANGLRSIKKSCVTGSTLSILHVSGHNAKIEVKALLSGPSGRAARLLGLCVRIQKGALMSVMSFVCCQVEVSASG